MRYLLTATNINQALEPKTDSGGLGSSVLLHNARWFIKVRWIVVLVFAAVGAIAAFIPGVSTLFGSRDVLLWPWVLGGVLAAANVFFWLLSRGLNENSSDAVADANICVQIGVDLLVVTVLVHYVGSTSTFVAFTYLFHVVLACIFFSPVRSFLVALVAGILYFGCVALELLGIWPAEGVMGLQREMAANETLTLAYAVSATLVWFVVWYLVASLARTLRERTRQLEVANQRLRVADAEKNRIVLQTAHDLKAPFSGIDSNIQVLKLQYWDDLPEKVKEILLRIETRARTLSKRIRDVLVLGGLRSGGRKQKPNETIDLTGLLTDICRDMAERAARRHVDVTLETLPCKIKGDPENFSMLFSNIILDSIVYSYEGGDIAVAMNASKQYLNVYVKDHGIGISEEDLPHIFEEYYRTAEASRHNCMSTGLGLSIVKEIAHREGLSIAVESSLGRGTTFDVGIPIERCEFWQ